MTGISRAARVLAGLSAALSAWAVLTTIAGGVYFTLGGFTVSSRNPVRPGVLAIVIASIAWRLDGAWAEAVARRIHEVPAPLLRAFAVPAAAAALLCGGMFFNVRAAIGADAFGYVSRCSGCAGT